jgi:segregation and condensation protein B
MFSNDSIDNDNFYFTTLSEINKAIPSSGFDFSYAEDKVERKETLMDKEGQTSLVVKSIIDEAKRENLKLLKGRVEAILFLSDKPRGADSIAKQASADLDLIRQVLAELVEEYEGRQGGITIDCSNGYCMQIADRYEDLTGDILPIALRTAVLRTLSTIALKEPILQKDLVTIRGGGVYEHVKELGEMGLVKKTKDGHQNLLHTTKFFSENFKLSQNGLELKTVLMKASPTDVEFVRPNTLIPGHEYDDESDPDRNKISEIQNTIQEKEEFLESN